MTPILANDVLNAALPLDPTRFAEMPDLPSAELMEAQLSEVEREMNGLRDEVDSLRKRDGALNHYMQRLDEELRLAARLQQDFLPRTMPQVGNVRFHAMWRPAGYVSGDLYDVIRLDESHVGFYIADAVGHGMPAALLTMFIKNALVTKEIGRGSYRLLEPGEALERLNDALIGQGLSAGTFCTACYGVIDTNTLELRLANAGHPAPMLIRGDDPPTSLRVQGPLLGIFENEKFETASFQLAPGDRMITFTDGIEVAFAGRLDHDTAPWEAELWRRRHLPGEALLNDLTTHLDLECGSLDPRDDLTLLITEVV